MIVRTIFPLALLAAVMKVPAASAQQPPSRSPAQEQIMRDTTTVSPAIARQIRQSSVAARDVIIQPIEDAVPPPATADPPAPSDEMPATAALSALDSDETVTISMSALNERLNGIRDATVFQDGRRTAVATSTASVALEKGVVLSVRSMDAQPVQFQANGNTQAASSTLLYALDTQGVTRELALVHRSQGLSWDQTNRLFAGTLFVGIVDRDRPSAQAILPEPIPVQLLSAGKALKPTELSIDRIGGRFQEVEIMLADPEDPYAIQLISPVDPNLPDASLPLRRLALVLVAPAQLDALGVGEGDVTVRARNGRLRSGESVTLNLDNGELASKTLVVGDDGTASTRVRSTGLGTGTLSLVAGPYIAEPVTIRYPPPYLLLIATILGAMLGASVFVYSLMRGDDRKQRFIVDWLVGCIVGIGATAMVYAGMRLPEWIPMPESLVGVIVPFALAFVCSAMGAALIHFFTGFREQPPAPAPQPLPPR